MNLDDLVIISVDDHVVEPATMFDHHLSAEHLALAPRYVCDEEGSYSWWWAHENKRTDSHGLNAVVGRPKEECGFEPTSISQMRRGTWDVNARIDDMNVNGLFASLNFGNFGTFGTFGTFVGFDGSFWTAKDKPNALRLVRA
jgi:hypothetical protein